MDSNLYILAGAGGNVLVQMGENISSLFLLFLMEKNLSRNDFFLCSI